MAEHDACEWRVVLLSLRLLKACSVQHNVFLSLSNVKSLTFLYLRFVPLAMMCDGSELVNNLQNWEVATDREDASLNI